MISRNIFTRFCLDLSFTKLQEAEGLILSSYGGTRKYLSKINCALLGRRSKGSRGSRGSRGRREKELLLHLKNIQINLFTYLRPVRRFFWCALVLSNIILSHVAVVLFGTQKWSRF